MLINQKTHYVKDWAGYESEQIKSLEEAINHYEHKIKLMDYAFLAKNAGKMYIFEDNLYKDIEEKHLRCFNIFYFNFIFSIVEHLEKDCLTIEMYHNHLILYKDIKDYEQKIADIRNQNENNYEQVAELEMRFIQIYENLNEIRQLQSEILDMDQEIKAELEIMEIEKMKLNDNRKNMTPMK